MHKKGFIHRDIKPENILISKNSGGEIECKISDFGLATCYMDQKSERKGEGVVGTPIYMSPEIIKK